MTYVTRKNGVKIVFTDVGGARDMRHSWRQFYRAADAVVNIVFFVFLLPVLFVSLFVRRINRIVLQSVLCAEDPGLGGEEFRFNFLFINKMSDVV
jgi:ADP-ribosylation factor family